MTFRQLSQHQIYLYILKTTCETDSDVITYSQVKSFLKLASATEADFKNMLSVFPLLQLMVNVGSVCEQNVAY